MTYVFLDPDGLIGNFGLLVIVKASTGVSYGHQCAGLATEVRVEEGFLVPVGNEDEAGKFVRFFHEQFRGNAYPGGASWSEDHVNSLAELVSSIPFWITRGEDGNSDSRHFLEFDRSRFDETAEAWIPVITPLGLGALLFQNCD